MEEQKKDEGIIDKAVDLFNGAEGKINDFVKEHDLDGKIDKATDVVEKGFKSAFDSLKETFGKKD
ncbi:MAG: hypothetical protein J5819_10625 [Eubacterium sp.]|nr:hypothetical protein [Eubacterium sp.]